MTKAIETTPRANTMVQPYAEQITTMAPAPTDPLTAIVLQIAVALPPAAAHKPALAIAAYAFARSGQLIDKRTIPARGHVQLRLPDLKVAQEVRVMLGPDNDNDRLAVTELLRRGALEQVVRVATGVEAPVLRFLVSPEVYGGWARKSSVRGVLVLGTPMHTRLLAMSGSRVQIWEVEPAQRMIERLPDAIVADFASLLSEAAGRTVTLRATAALDMRSVVRAARVYARTPLIGERFRLLQRSACFAALLRVAGEPAHVLRTELIAHAGTLTDLLYLLYPAWIRKQLLANAAVDDEGRFRIDVYPSRCCERLNLYFTASATLNGVSLPIYDPKPVATAIYWDYQTGCEVILNAEAAECNAGEPSPICDAEAVNARGSASAMSPPRYRSA